MIAIMARALFHHLSDRAGPMMPVAAGAYLARRGDPVTRLFLLLDGAVHMTRDRADGAPLILHHVGPGGVIAEASLHHRTYHCDLAVAATGRVRSIPVGTARAELAMPEAAALLAAHLATALQAARTRAELLALPNLRDRLEVWEALNGPLPGRGQWRTLAAEIGVTPEALYRALAQRRRLGHSPSGED